MNEDALLSAAVEVLEPTPGQVARLRSAIEGRLERERRSLASEWLDLLRLRPLTHTGLALGASLTLLLTTPLGALLWAFAATSHG